jgi:hypothetical protein
VRERAELVGAAGRVRASLKELSQVEARPAGLCGGGGGETDVVVICGRLARCGGDEGDDGRPS